MTRTGKNPENVFVKDERIVEAEIVAVEKFKPKANNPEWICSICNIPEIKRGRAVCFDCDGVLHKYSKGYQDGSIYDEPIMPMVKLVAQLQKMGFPCFICSTRKPEQIIEWWNNNKLGTEAVKFPDDVIFWKDRKHIAVTNIKKPAQIYIDDRAYLYSGQSIEDILKDLGLTKEKKDGNDRN